MTSRLWTTRRARELSSPRRLRVFRGPLLGLAFILPAAACTRTSVPEPTYGDAVVAFYTGLAAMQTSQEVLARRELERATSLVPGEAAAWADLGLLLMRQQDIEAAAPALAKAAELAPRSAAVERLVALLEGLRGHLPEAIQHWKRAVVLDPDDTKAPYALAMDTERLGAAESDGEAQRLLEGLVDRSGNLAARLEVARLAAKRGDEAGLRRAVGPLSEASRSWRAPAQEQLKALQAALSDARAASLRVSFLKNVLLGEPEYRHALAALRTPREEVGEPISRFLVLANPEPLPAPPDTALAFKIDPLDQEGGATSATPVWTDDTPIPSVIVADASHVRQGGQGIAFPSGATSPGPDSVVAGDFGYAYRQDLLLAGGGGLKLLRAGANHRFEDVTATTHLSPGVLSRPESGAWVADIDADGDLDVVLGPLDGPPVLLRNNGDGTFTDQPIFPGVERLRGFAWADLDGDGLSDATLLDAEGRVHVFVNQRGGAFHEESLPAEGRGFAAVTVETPGDSGHAGILAVRATGEVVRLFLGEDRRHWVARSVARLSGAPPGLAPGSARLLLADLDNNGAADLIVAGSTTSRVLLAGSDGAFVPLPAVLPMGVQAAVDLDGGGRLALVGVTEGGRVVKASGRGQKAYAWEEFRTRSATATGSQRINSFGIGGEVEIRSRLHLQARPIVTPVVHFGLGEAKKAEVVRVLWPNGILQSEFNTDAQSTIAATQRLKGSCPWLFGWNGREMAFVTDLLWRSPLGLKINAQATADVLMTEDWVKVRGDQLTARNGVYDLRVTAELWETHFFDKVALAVVDHPEGTEVFVDERFAVPAPRLEVIPTDAIRPMAAARDQSGRDVSGLVRERDGRHLDVGPKGPYQGITPHHYVELELPEEAPRTGPLWLVGQGWIHPTDSSINVAISQGSHPKPEGLSLSVRDASGRFRVAREGLGFPSGKDKTVLLDLQGLLPRAGPRVLRLSTNLEIYWDRLGWTTPRPDLRLQPQTLGLGSAVLRSRGFSVTEQADPSSPERPRYLLEGTSPRWLDLEGYYTRFGDVRELLSRVDDRYVIMNAGDELLLTFPQAPPPAPGLVRDFILMADGWVKDGDFNTTFSRTVLPLPSHARARYDEAPGELEDDPVYRAHVRDFETYHTRYVSPEGVRGALNR